jgi:hypothetical protein
VIQSLFLIYLFPQDRRHSTSSKQSSTGTEGNHSLGSPTAAVVVVSPSTAAAADYSNTNGGVIVETVNSSLTTLNEEEDNNEQSEKWKPEIPFGNVRRWKTCK